MKLRGLQQRGTVAPQAVEAIAQLLLPRCAGAGLAGTAPKQEVRLQQAQQPIHFRQGRLEARSLPLGQPVDAEPLNPLHKIGLKRLPLDDEIGGAAGCPVLLAGLLQGGDLAVKILQDLGVIVREMKGVHRMRSKRNCWHFLKQMLRKGNVFRYH